MIKYRITLVSDKIEEVEADGYQISSDGAILVFLINGQKDAHKIFKEWQWFEQLDRIPTGIVESPIATLSLSQ